jgi:hypothetical protein
MSQYFHSLFTNSVVKKIWRESDKNRLYPNLYPSSHLKLWGCLTISLPSLMMWEWCGCLLGPLFCQIQCHIWTWLSVWLLQIVSFVAWCLWLIVETWWLDQSMYILPQMQGGLINARFLHQGCLSLIDGDSVKLWRLFRANLTWSETVLLVIMDKNQPQIIVYFIIFISFTIWI